MTQQRKRKALRIYEDDPEGESDLPVMRTSKLVENHKASHSKGKYAHKNSSNELGENEAGKELFDFVLKGMSTPEDDKKN